VFFEAKLGAVPLSTSFPVPSVHLAGGGEIRLTTHKSFFPIMHRADVNGEVALLCEASSTSRNCAREGSSFFLIDAPMSYLQMAAELPRCRANNRTIRALRWMFGLDVSLKLRIGGKANLWRPRPLALQGSVLITQVIGALGASKAVFSMRPPLMGSKVTSILKGLGAFLSSN
jgi:hypothetical protein